MAAVRVLADEHIKLTMLTAAPADELDPTPTELNAGTDVQCFVFADNFRWTAADSEKVGERALCEATAAESPGIGNYDLAITAWRYFDSTTGAVDAAADSLFQAVKVKGTELWFYARRTGKAHDAAWAAGDEIQLGGRVATDTPQATDNTGFIKYAIPLSAQAMVDFHNVSGT